MREALSKAVELVGGQTQLARLLGVKQSHVWHWLNRAERLPAEFVLPIENATGGQVNRHMLRPDLFPDSSAPHARIAVADEDMWRAQMYTLFARCLSRRPDVGLLTALGQLTGDGSALGQAITELSRVARSTSIERAQEEWDALFVGLARGELLPYASYYRTGFLYEQPLAKLRGDMKELGFVVADGVSEPEDHIGALCEMMALLIAGGDIGGKPAAPASIAQQEQFFRTHLAPWAEKFFADLEKAASASLLKPLGRIGRQFIGIETQGFALAA
ncbi:MAG: molecular chaperone TorD family protein [Rhodospirillales bacterium]|nr:molecular chaperone TorD family protein [Rhodospirillales bacterium]